MEGKFSLGTLAEGDGVPPGKYKVSVVSNQEIQTKDGEILSKSLVPSRYTSPDSSLVIVDIPAEGKKDIKIDLED